MKKSKIKFIIKKTVLKHYAYIGGFTATADKLQKEITDELNKLYAKKHKQPWQRKN